IIFDKTGTLTRGTPAVSDVAAVSGTTESQLLASAAAVESSSEHPLAKAIVAAARRRNSDSIAVTGFKSLPGRGAAATVQGTTIAVGGPRLLADSKLQVTPELQQTTTIWAQEGKTVLYVVSDGALLGVIAAEDEI